MRRLNLLRAYRSPDCWENHQLSCIEDAVTTFKNAKGLADVASIAPLLPGSSLFNQMVKTDLQSEQLALQHRPSVTSLDSVYESLSFPVHWPQGTTILVDIINPDQWCMNALRETVALLLEDNQSNTEIETLLVLQPLQLTELQNMFASFPLRVQSLHSDWCNVAQMLAYYRGASHSVFINTTRAADAAFCNIPNTLICNQPFIDSQETNALWRVLADSSTSQVMCEVPVSCGVNLPLVPIIDNRMGDLQSALCESNGDSTDDWLAEYMVAAELNSPVIHGEAGWRKSVQKIIDTRISLRRKGQKLQEDPKQFCVDSKNPLLRALGRLLPSRVAA